MINKKKITKIFMIFGIIVIVIATILGISVGIIKYYDQFYFKNYDKEILIIDKEESRHTTYIKSGNVLVPVTTYSYNIYGKNGEVMGISSYQYKVISVGDYVLAKSTAIYYKKDNSLHKIEYKFKEKIENE